MIPEPDLQQQYEAIFPLLNERQRRVIAAADALFLGRGGGSQAARASGLSRTTLPRGLAALAEHGQADTRIRQAGGGRQRVVEHSPESLAALEALVEPATRGDPRSPWRWTCQSPRQLAAALAQQGSSIRPPTGASWGHDWGDSLQANTTTRAGTSHPDRAHPFRDIHASGKRYLKSQRPVLFVDTQTKARVGPSKLDFVQLRRVAERFREALQQGAWDFNHIGLLVGH